MKNRTSLLLRIVLVISGAIAILIGATILLLPTTLAATSGIDLGQHPSLLSETRAPGGALLANGVLILIGSFRSSLTMTSALVGAIVYLSYGLSRILSMALDGIPAETLVYVTIAEIAMGLIVVLTLLREQRSVRHR